jgi:hypothetical protein
MIDSQTNLKFPRVREVGGSLTSLTALIGDAGVGKAHQPYICRNAKIAGLVAQVAAHICARSKTEH